MAGQAWLESSLRRSARLGLEVLERASRRSVDWTSSAASPSTTHTCNGGAHIHRGCTELSDAFATIADFMDKTSYQCRRFYESGCCSEPSDAEKTHMSRFHPNPLVTGSSAPRPSRKPPRDRGKNAGRDSFTEEDFYIEVSPGTYAITASLPKSRHQTQMVSIKAGESIDLTFDL
ncbi:A-kinase-interacting protein 1 [Oryzias melastigma]|uniref:A kinase (PRKA) interacting protein 1 n=1 Tax=Oryzias melastigma TaxID=30732 RepID=A0A3B3CZ12_ORYME|nr:A-kinase-interacting protein 1 [Oryzias melastigma]XP_024138559.1 A-kinase-interacting protein 1 [Oryzias melastigma]XP_024138560.1 A-kinase-interacting protein 1 [Oryzias melastigma]KAF6721560.1 A-kinase-interacting protein 1 [Oryzias melastigma]